MEEVLLIVDFGSQYTQLIARRIRELNVYCEIHPFNNLPSAEQLDPKAIKGVILSGGPASVRDIDAPDIQLEQFRNHYPLLGICYGAQLLVQKNGGEVEPSAIREYGRANLNFADQDERLLKNIPADSQVWMSHGDTIKNLPDNFKIIAGTQNIPVAAYHIEGEQTFGLQFHPEVVHSLEGKDILRNFIKDICGFAQSWTPAHFVDETVAQLKEELGNDKVVMALSGGVDSSVAAVLVSQAIGENLHCVFVDNGLLRKDEYQQVLDSYKELGLNITGVNAADDFYVALHDIKDPELKRKAIGKAFIDIFDREAHAIEDVKWLGQGTIYPDVIESVSVKGPSATIKSHHNVGGLPERMHLKVVEPLRSLFKDEVRRVGRELKIPEAIIGRHPFPGPGLAIRILGDVTEAKVKMLQEADALFINGLKEHGLYDDVWQAGAILLPVQSVGVMGDSRTYENCVALRAVASVDGMTADWVHLPYEFLAEISNKIINSVKGINRVVYDISSKPPATIEWE